MVTAPFNVLTSIPIEAMRNANRLIQITAIFVAMLHANQRLVGRTMHPIRNFLCCCPANRADGVTIHLHNKSLTACIFFHAQMFRVLFFLPRLHLINQSPAYPFCSPFIALLHRALARLPCNKEIMASFGSSRITIERLKILASVTCCFVSAHICTLICGYQGRQHQHTV